MTKWALPTGSGLVALLLTAVAVPAGEHEIRFVYDPLSYRIGAILSLLTWGSLAIVGIVLLIRNRTIKAQRTQSAE